MRRNSSCRWWWFPLFASAVACSRPDERGAGTPAADTSTAAAPAGTSPALLTVLYNQPQDTAAFERYYRTTHLPLVVANQKEIGFTRADLTRFIRTVDGKKPTYYRQAELYFNSLHDLRKGMASPGFKKVTDDLSNFATGGLTGMIGTLSNAHDGGVQAKTPAAIVTVIYKNPKDSAAFERYYADVHLPLVTKSKNAIGFKKAELTKFVSNLDGDSPARYRQAVLHFSSIDALKKGLETPAFQKVAADLGKFASGGLDALIGMETR
jgi:uncharacterized protein (TIGR02118 family)